MKKLIFSLIVLLGVAIALTPAYGKGPITLKMVTFLPRGDVNLTALMAFMEDVNKKAKGELEIKYVGGPEAIPGFKQFEAVRTGVVDIILGCESYYGRQVTGAAYTHLSRISPMQERENGYYDFRVELLKKHKVHYLGRAQYGPWFNIFTNKAVKGPKELKGQKIRVSATYEPFVKTLGAVPVTLPGSDIYTASSGVQLTGMPGQFLAIYRWGGVRCANTSWNPEFTR